MQTNTVVSGQPDTKASAPRLKTTRGAKKVRPRKESYTIAYRVDEKIFAWLTEGALPYRVSVHEFARQKLIETMEAKELAELRSDASDLTQGMANLREDLAVTLEVLLANLTSTDPAHIRAWINENLREA